jgi:acetyl-CoA C-acetyltransferase
MSDPSRIPVVVGVGQASQREEVLDGVEMACHAARAAFDDAPGISPHIQRVSMVAISFSPAGPAPASEAAARLGLTDVACEVSTPGGNSPQWLVTRAAEDISAGRLDTTLILGGEATRSMRAGDPNATFLAAAQGPRDEQGPADPIVGPSVRGLLSPVEIAAELAVPAILYAMFESARAHAAGRSPAEQRAHLAPLYARFSEVAAANPFAWFRDKRSPAEIGEASADNRIISEPYTKRMNSFPNVDQGSALLVTTLERARAAGLEAQCVFPWSGATNTEPAPVARPAPGEAPAIRVAAAATFAGAGVGIDDVAHIDIYSCFPSAVCAAAEGLGLALDDPRGLTTTGGMSFFGGPGNNYSGHGIATLVGRIRESGELGIATANGGFLSKHSLGIYGATPPAQGFVAANTDAEQREIAAAALPIATEASGDATVDAGTVHYARDGSVARAPIMARLPGGERVIADADPACLQELAGRSIVGERVELAGSPVTYRV